MIINLLKETLEKLATHNKVSEDVQWVGSRDGRFAMLWTDFMAIANREYDAGFGGQVVAPDLVVVGKNWWLERHEYDGSEWWEYKSLPRVNKKSQPFEEVFTNETYAEEEWKAKIRAVGEAKST